MREGFELSLHVVGARFPNPKGKGNREFEIAVSEPGERVELRPEPKNKADPHAVAVYSCRGVQIGYVTAERAPWLRDELLSGREVAAIFQQPTQFGAAIRVAFDGLTPSLPPPSAAIRKPPAIPEGADEMPADFYPDDLPPDE